MLRGTPDRNSGGLQMDLNRPPPAIFDGFGTTLPDPSKSVNAPVGGLSLPAQLPQPNGDTLTSYPLARRPLVFQPYRYSAKKKALSLPSEAPRELCAKRLSRPPVFLKAASHRSLGRSEDRKVAHLGHKNRTCCLETRERRVLRSTPTKGCTDLSG